MRSVGSKGVTALTIITLIFTPVFHGHHKTEKLVKRTVTHETVTCKAHHKCPKTETITVRVIKKSAK